MIGTPVTVTSPVETTQIAPTILAVLGLDPTSLQAVRMERTQILPGLNLRPDKYVPFSRSLIADTAGSPWGTRGGHARLAKT